MRSRLKSMSKIFFDANILLDILLPGRANHEKAKKAYIKICDEFDILSTSENILTTIEYIAVKNKTPCDIVVKFFSSFKSNFEISNFTDILDEALILYSKACEDGKKIDFEDILQLECAIYHGCDAFVTEDKNILKNVKDIKIYSLDDFL